MLGNLPKAIPVQGALEKRQTAGLLLVGCCFLNRLLGEITSDFLPAQIHTTNILRMRANVYALHVLI